MPTTTPAPALPGAAQTSAKRSSQTLVIDGYLPGIV